MNRHPDQPYLQAVLVDALEISLDGFQLSTALCVDDLANTIPLLRPTPLTACLHLSRLNIPQITEIQTDLQIGRLDARLTQDTLRMLAALGSEMASILRQAGSTMEFNTATSLLRRAETKRSVESEQVGCHFSAPKFDAPKFYSYRSTAHLDLDSFESLPARVRTFEPARLDLRISSSPPLHLCLSQITVGGLV
jgi:hypothetical protein